MAIQVVADSSWSFSRVQEHGRTRYAIPHHDFSRQAYRLIGTPNCPALIDVSTDEDFASDPRLIPCSARRPDINVREWGASIAHQSVVVVCQGGKELS